MDPKKLCPPISPNLVPRGDYIGKDGKIYVNDMVQDKWVSQERYIEVNPDDLSKKLLKTNDRDERSKLLLGSDLYKTVVRCHLGLEDSVFTNVYRVYITLALLRWKGASPAKLFDLKAPSIGVGSVDDLLKKDDLYESLRCINSLSKHETGANLYMNRDIRAGIIMYLFYECGLVKDFDNFYHSDTRYKCAIVEVSNNREIDSLVTLVSDISLGDKKLIRESNRDVVDKYIKTGKSIQMQQCNTLLSGRTLELFFVQK